MKGIEIIELVRIGENNPSYRCLVEAIINHEMSPEDPLTAIIMKGAQGIASEFWSYGGNWWRPTIGVKWDNKYSGGDSCVYTETYKRKNKIRRKITEIKFVCKIDSDLILPEENPLIVHPDKKTVEDYFKR